MQSIENVADVHLDACPPAKSAYAAGRAKYIGNKIKLLARFLGPAFIVSVAYIDPGNFATNISGGSQFNYSLVWVVLWSNLMAIFLQTISAKLGIATGKNLPEMCAQVFSRPVNRVFWVVAELAAMATDLAEFLGGTLGLYLLFHIPMLAAAIVTGVLTYLICYLEKYGQRLVELIISLLIAVICAAYVMEIFLAKPDFAAAGLHALVPGLPNRDAIFIAAGMLGATVMPHVIYLHSQLVLCRCKNAPQSKKTILKYEKLDIAIAMNIAFLVNAAMVIVSAAVFYKNGIVVTTMEQAQRSLEPLLGPLSGGAFGIALIASGLSSSAVGTMAGQTIMKGFVNLSIPVNLRRLITMLPAIIIIAIGVSPMNALVVSQVALSFLLPVPVIQLLVITRRKDLMGGFANSKPVQAAGILITAVIVTLNLTLIFATALGLC